MARVEFVPAKKAERLGRFMLACAIAGTIPLALWGGACGKRPVVEPTADGGIDGVRDTAADLPAIDRPYASDLLGIDAVDAPDAPSAVDSAGDGTVADLAGLDTTLDLALDQMLDRPTDLVTDFATDQITDQAGQDYPSVPDAAAGCCSATTADLCSGDGRSLIACRMFMNQCNPVGIYGWVWMTQACADGCTTEGSGGPDGAPADAKVAPHCR